VSDRKKRAFCYRGAAFSNLEDTGKNRWGEKGKKTHNNNWEARKPGKILRKGVVRYTTDEEKKNAPLDLLPKKKSHFHPMENIRKKGRPAAQRTLPPKGPSAGQHGNGEGGGGGSHPPGKKKKILAPNPHLTKEKEGKTGGVFETGGKKKKTPDLYRPQEHPKGDCEPPAAPSEKGQPIPPKKGEGNTLLAGSSLPAKRKSPFQKGS